VLGWWNLCYLDDQEIQNYIDGLKICIKSKGYIIFCEPTADITHMIEPMGDKCVLRSQKD
jgi:hypothetical protein